jgi:hypothetical protein
MGPRKPSLQRRANKKRPNGVKIRKIPSIRPIRIQISAILACLLSTAD